MTTETPPRTYYTGDETRYQQAKAQVAETQGNIWTERDRWRLATLLLACIVLVMAVAWLRVSRRPSHEPVYLTKNAEDQLRVLQWEDLDLTELEIKRDLLLWMRCVRALPTDRPTVERCWRIVPMFLLDRSQPWMVVKAHYDQLQPTKSVYQKSIDVQDLDAMREPDGRWRVTWQEDVYGMPSGGGVGKLDASASGRRTAILLVSHLKPTKRTQIMLDHEPINRFGLYITGLSWRSE